MVPYAHEQQHGETKGKEREGGKRGSGLAKEKHWVPQEREHKWVANFLSAPRHLEIKPFAPVELNHFFTTDILIRFEPGDR